MVGANAAVEMEVDDGADVLGREPARSEERQLLPAELDGAGAERLR
jgi:hypothetical protein